MEIRKSLYLDTNAFIYAYFYIHSPEVADQLTNLDYFRKGEEVLKALGKCRNNNVRVFSTDITFLEMTHNYYEWAKFKKFLELGAPPGLIFGKNQRMDAGFLKQPLPREEHQQIIRDSENWLNTWAFRDLVEFRTPDAIPNWLEIAKFLNSVIHETVLDCMHLAAAISLECDFFLTEDIELRKVATSLRTDVDCKNEIRNKFDLSNDYGLPNPVASHTFRV